LNNLCYFISNLLNFAVQLLVFYLAGSAPFYLDEDKSILVFKYGSESDVLLCEKKSGVAAVCLNEYIEVII